MRSSIFASIGPIALLFLKPVVAGDDWVGYNWGDEDLSTTTSCTDALIAATFTQAESDSTITLTDTETVTYTLYPQRPSSSFMSSYVAPSYHSPGWITKTWRHHRTITVTLSDPSEPEWSYQPQPTWDPPAEPTWGSPLESADPCTTEADTTITITNTIMETITDYPAESPTQPMDYGSLPASLSWSEPSPYAAPTSSDPCTTTSPYGSYTAPSSAAALPIDPPAYTYEEQSSSSPEPQVYQPVTEPAAVSEPAATSASNSYQPPTTNPALYEDSNNNDGYIEYAWTA